MAVAPQPTRAWHEQTVASGRPALVMYRVEGLEGTLELRPASGVGVADRVRLAGSGER